MSRKSVFWDPGNWSIQLREEKRFFRSQNLVKIYWNSEIWNTFKLFWGLSYLQFWRLRVKNNVFIRLTVSVYAVWWMVVDPGIEILLSSFWTTRARLFKQEFSCYNQTATQLLLHSKFCNYFFAFWTGLAKKGNTLLSNWILLIPILAIFIGPYSSFCGSPLLRSAGKVKIKVQRKNTLPHRLTAYFPLICDW